MKRLGKIAVCLAGGLALSIGAGAGGVVSAGHPYEPIVERNVFGLNPPSTNAPTTPENEHLVKITPNGIMSIFGQLQVLFKVAPKPGVKDAKEVSYVLSEGQAQDEIEVVRINEKAALVTFNNHGTVQELPLANAPKLNLPAPAGGGGGGGVVPPRVGGPRGGSPGGTPAASIGGQTRGTGVVPGGNPSSSTGGGPALSSVPTRSRGGRSSQASMSDALSAEEQMVIVAAQKLKAHEEGDPAAAIYPPTPFDAEIGIPSPPVPPGATAR